MAAEIPSTAAAPDARSAEDATLKAVTDMLEALQGLDGNIEAIRTVCRRVKAVVTEGQRRVLQELLLAIGDGVTRKRKARDGDAGEQRNERKGKRRDGGRREDIGVDDGGRQQVTGADDERRQEVMGAEVEGQQEVGGADDEGQGQDTDQAVAQTIAKPWRWFWASETFNLDGELGFLLDGSVDEAAERFLQDARILGCLTTREGQSEVKAFSNLYRVTAALQDRQTLDRIRWLLLMLTFREVVRYINPTGSARVGSSIKAEFLRSYLPAGLLEQMNVSMEEMQSNLGQWSVWGEHVGEFCQSLGFGSLFYLHSHLSRDFISKKYNTSKVSREAALGQLKERKLCDTVEGRRLDQVAVKAYELLRQPFGGLYRAAQGDQSAD